MRMSLPLVVNTRQAGSTSLCRCIDAGQQTEDNNMLVLQDGRLQAAHELAACGERLGTSLCR
jgi:hypothetical protein